MSTKSYARYLQDRADRLVIRASAQCSLIACVREGNQSGADTIECALSSTAHDEPSEQETIASFFVMIGIFPTDVIAEAVAAWGYEDDPEFCTLVAEGMPEPACRVRSPDLSAIVWQKMHPRTA